MSNIVTIKTKYQSKAKLFPTTGSIVVSDIDSTSVKAFRWNSNLKWLTVEYAQGVKYRYKGVEFGTVASLLTADSVGKAVNAEVKGHHIYEKIED
jgi:hypothetical protein